MCTQTLTNSQLNVLYGTKTTNSNEETENKRNQDMQKKQSSHKDLGVSPEAGTESMVERGRF